MGISTADYLAMLARLNVVSTPVDAESVSQESELAGYVIADCNRRGWLWFRSATNRKSTRRKGEQDVVVMCDGGRVVFTELKSKTGKLSSEQLGIIAWAKSLGHTIHVLSSKKGWDELAAGRR